MIYYSIDLGLLYVWAGAFGQNLTLLGGYP